VVALPMPLDLTDDDSIIATARHVEKEYGRLDVLVNNAAICFI
jgi:NAD(P)-dependent dehydrogenase (short-subunit alcohol dehydrogenase family)